jgi:hypothetical protein
MPKRKASPGKHNGPHPKPSNQDVAKARALLDTRAAEEAEAIFTALLAAALEGDVPAIALLVARIWPTRRGAAIKFVVPPAKNAAGVGVALDVLLEQAAGGVLTIDEAARVSNILQTKLAAFEAGAVDERLGKLEEALHDLQAGRSISPLGNGEGSRVQ